MAANGFCPFALNKNIPPGSNDPRISPELAILHVDAGNAHSLYNYFNGPSGGIESHFHVRLDGVIEQYRSIWYEADANYKANPRAVSIETQGYGAGTWNTKQLEALKALLVWLHREAGIPLQKASGPYGRGIGYHVQFGAPGAWTPVAKSCPGPGRIAQYENDIIPWTKVAMKPVSKTRNRVQKARAHLRKAKALIKEVPEKRKLVRSQKREIGDVLRTLPKK